MCTVLLPPGGYPIAVNKYIIYHIVLYIQKIPRIKMILYIIKTTYLNTCKLSQVTSHDFQIQIYCSKTVIVLVSTKQSVSTTTEY